MQTDTRFDFEFSWDVEEKADDPKDYWKWYNLQNCGKPKWTLDPSTGEPVVEYFRNCNQAHCPRCQARRQRQEANRLSRIDKKKTKYCEVDESEEKKLVRKYGKDNIRRIPLSNGKTAFLIETDDILPDEQEFTAEIAEMLIEEVVNPENNRRPSGNLGKAPSTPLVKEEETPPKEETTEFDWNQKEELTYCVEVRVKECTANFNSNNPDAPKNPNELYEMVHEEVEIYENPQDHKELWAGVNLLQDKAEEICNRYDMSFRCIKTITKNIDVLKVDWKWTKKKRKPE